MALNIVQLNVSATNPPAPSTLQKTGVFLTQGGTNTVAGTKTLLTATASLTASLPTAAAISTLTWTLGVVTVGTTVAHGLPIGQTINLTIAGETPAAYNGTFACTITGASAFTYPLVSNPGASTVQGTWINASVAELVAMNTTFWAQSANQSVYVLELGASDTAHGVTALSAFITANPRTVYIYLHQRAWDGDATFKALTANYEAPGSLTKFIVTTTIGTYSTWTALQSSVLAVVEAPTIPATEFSAAAWLNVTLGFTPNSGTPIAPLAFRFIYGVTAYPTVGNSTLLTTLKTANINYVGTGAEGGLSNTLVAWGHILDGNPFNYWYTVDWAVINLDLNLANEIINGSNNSLAPLYYDQLGINRLQNRAAQTIRNGVSYGLILGQVLTVALDPQTFAANVASGLYAGNAVINAVPFTTYSSQNPSDYMIGQYNGLQISITPKRGFEAIIISLSITNFTA